MRTLTTAFVCLTSIGALASAQDGPAGHWHGRIDLKKLGGFAIEVTLAEREEGWAGTISIPEQGAYGLDLNEVKVEGDRVRFVLPSPQGRARFDGNLKDGMISGVFRQLIIKGSFELERGRLPIKRFEPETPPTYRSEDVVIPAGAHTLAGTLTIPKGKGPFPAAVFVTGSGAQTRDEEVAGFPVLGLLADQLSRRGICVLRYDDRGTGRSTGKFEGSTTFDFADDAHAAYRWLVQRKEVDAKRAGVIGHSEGGLVAPLVAARDPSLDYIVLLAGPAVDGKAVLLLQGRLIGEANGSSKEELAATERIQKLAFAASAGHAKWEAVEKAIRDGIDAEIRRGGAMAKLLKGNEDKAVQAQVKQLRTPWMKTFLEHDPLPVFEGVRCRTLALFGEKDLQVPPAQSAPLFERLFEKRGNGSAVLTIKSANHLFQTAKTGSPKEYARLGKKFAPGFVDAVVGFVLAKRP